MKMAKATTRKATKVEVWKCSDLKALVKETKTIIKILITVCFAATTLLVGGFAHAETASAQTSDIVTFDNIRDAQKRISGQIVRTPFL